MRTLMSCLVWLSIGCGALLSQDMPLSDVLIDGEGWQLVAEGYRFTEGPAVDQDGNLYFVDVPNELVLKVDHQTAQVEVVSKGQGNTSGLMFGADNRLYGSQNRQRRIVVFDEKGNATPVATDLGANDLVVASNGNIYCTDPKQHQVWLVRPDGSKQVVAKDIASPNGIILWGDEGTLVVADSASEHLYAFRVEADGTLSYGATCYTMRMPKDETRSRADGMTVDQNGRLYVATTLGLQMFDSTARISGVLLKPEPLFLSNVVFAGPEMDTLYITLGGKLYRRKTQVKGVRYGARSGSSN